MDLTGNRTPVAWLVIQSAKQYTTDPIYIHIHICMLIYTYLSQNVPAIVSHLTTDLQLLKNKTEECAKFEMLFKQFGACEQLSNTANEM